MNNNKGFTLIELLAVIIILGILMIIAIPSVTSYINNSRKSAYVNTAKEIVSGARTFVNEGKLEMFDTGATYYIPVSCISTENGQKSPYGDFVENQAFVIVTYTGSNYNYFWISRDTTGQGVKTITPVGELDEDDIVSDISSSEITPTEPAETGKNTIKVLSKDDCKTFGEGTDENPTLIGCDGNCICRRVTNESELHTATCTKTGTYGCAVSIGDGNKITYGNAKASGTPLASGDALDCDLNGNGIYNERFYFVTDNGDNAVLIYYKNMSDNSTTAYALNSTIQSIGETCDNYSGCNWYGPLTAYQVLPNKINWSNDKIIAPKENKQITNELGNNTTSNGEIVLNKFTYSQKVARLLTYQEVKDACGDNIEERGSLEQCNYLMENINGYESSGNIYGYWLETPRSSSSTSVWYLTAYLRRIDSGNSANLASYGVRPVIEVLKSNIEN